jgi:predicted metal-dependent hydrolase
MKPTYSTKRHTVAFGRAGIEFQLKRSKRRTLAITVKPDATVWVTAPCGAALEVVTAKVWKRAVWIRRQQIFFENYLPPMPPRRYVTGETHRYRGRQYRLKVIEGAEEGVKLKGRFLWVQTRRKRDTRRAKALLEAWYAEHARWAFEKSVAVCAGKFNGQLAGAPRLRLRHMPKRWGSWTKRGVIYLNPELILAPPSCIDYVVTHELCHLVHASHGAEFFALLRKTMPDWEQRKARLEQLAAESGVR